MERQLVLRGWTGTAWSIFPAAQNYGLTVETSAKIKENPAAFESKSANCGSVNPGEFTDVGHIMVIKRM